MVLLVSLILGLFSRSTVLCARHTVLGTLDVLSSQVVYLNLAHANLRRSKPLGYAEGYSSSFLIAR